MGKLLFGKEISSMSKEELAEKMKLMRSKRKNGNGRLGKKNKENFSTGKIEDFKDETKKRNGNGPRRFNNEHIKCVFVCSRELYPSKTAKAQTPIYLIGFLTDSNKYSFEQYRDTSSVNQYKVTKNIGANRVKKFSEIFQQKNIDSETLMIIDMDRAKEDHFFMQQLRLMLSFTGCRSREVCAADIIEKIVSEYDVYTTDKTKSSCKTYSLKGINKVFSKIYSFIAENSLCPWITVSEKELLDSIWKYRKHSLKLLHIGLFYSLIVKYQKMLKNAKRK